jgi:putative oxygen-independent coproporphyrinogen III oxidase
VSVDALPHHLADAISTRGTSPIGVYLHVPYCATRCGYCDFNTYTASELGPDTSRESWLADITAELRQAADLFGPVEVGTVFFGGGTPTLLPAEVLVAALGQVDRYLGVGPGAEVTTEANPESVDEEYLHTLRAGGFTRVSLGMQSSSTRVLKILDRQHDPERAVSAARAARSVGFDHVSLDLIYGTPGETTAEWRESLEAVTATGVDHVSAYALTVEQGTALAVKVNRGEVVSPDPDVAAARYETADEVLSDAGLQWYEISNFAATDGQCQHNLGYWRNRDWWGVGPGAHSHVSGLRWWNVKHPRTYADKVRSGHSPAAGFEVVDDAARRLESLMLQIRLREGIPLDDVPPVPVRQLVSEGLVTLERDRAVLTLRGRLLADRVTLALDAAGSH